MQFFFQTFYRAAEAGLGNIQVLAALLMDPQRQISTT